MSRIVFTENAPAPIGPYSQAVWNGNTLFVSGQIAIDAKSGKITGQNGESIEEETHKVMHNMKQILEAAGLSFSDVIKCGIFVKDMNDFQAINAAYGEYFKENPPARETVEVSRLPKDVRVEISCVAAKE
ncbi:MAG: reactive intermediate/imine deaminase [Flexibacter sp. CG_4_10_14_3_um_filter_32_15]|nr:MAG: reactive intermediate/imine deaminase [Flexibacter sp. CG_4_10_14_3_um_filter_32_15]